MTVVQPRPAVAVGHHEQRVRPEDRAQRIELRGRLERHGEQVLTAGDEAVEPGEHLAQRPGQRAQRQRRHRSSGFERPQPALQDRASNSSVVRLARQMRPELRRDGTVQDGRRSQREGFCGKRRSGASQHELPAPGSFTMLEANAGFRRLRVQRTEPGELVKRGRGLALGPRDRHHARREPGVGQRACAVDHRAPGDERPVRKTIDRQRADDERVDGGQAEKG